jgi:predicted outer membrane protein
VKISSSLPILAAAVLTTSQLSAQSNGASTLTEAELYSLYVARHAATIELAQLATTSAENKDVRKQAESLAKAHREAREKLEKGAGDRHLKLTTPAHDTSFVLLAQARTTLAGKTGRTFDSTWTDVTHKWLQTLLIDNNKAVKPRISPELMPVATAHTTWLFHQFADLDKLLKKFK